MPAGRFTPPDSSNSIETHGFCRVIAVAKPTSDSVIIEEKRWPSTRQPPSTAILPQGTDLSVYSQAQLDQVSLRLNQRPRKTLGFQTPASKLQASVASTV